MDVPPPLPRKGFSPSLLIALLLVVLAVVVRTIVAGDEGDGEVMKSALQGASFVIAGIVAAGTAVIFSVVALFDRRRGWPLSILVALAGVALVWLLFPELRKCIAKAKSEARRSMAEGFGLANQPIPLEKGASTAADLQPAIVAWGEEAMVRPYQEHGHHDAAWEDAALQLIRGTALELAQSAARPGPANLRVLGAKILRTECDDPWILFLIRRLGEYDSDHREAMEAAAVAVAQAGYPPFPTWLAQVEAVGAAQRQDGSAAEALVPPCLESLRAVLTEKPLSEADCQIWCAIFRYGVGEALLKQDGDAACHCVDSVPGTPPWFRLWLRGRMEVEQGWLARGSGWANTVDSEQWKSFGEHLAAARWALEEAWKLHPKEAQIASTQMAVELGSTGLPEMRHRFDAAVQAQFDFMPAYETFRKGLLPRWQGSTEALLAFGRNCLATQRFDTEVPFQMVRAVEDIAKDSKDDFEYYRHVAPWKELQAVLDGYLAHGDPARHNYYLSEKAVLAEKCGMSVTAEEALRQLNYQIDPQVREDWNLSVRWLERTHAYRSPVCNLLASAENQELAHPELALPSFLAAAKVPNLPPMTKEYLADRAVEMQANVGLKAASWQPLTPPPDLTGWKVGSGEWKVLSSTVLEVTTGDSGALLTRLEPVGDTWDVRGTFQFVSQTAGRTEAALSFGLPEEREPRGFSLRFWTTRDGSGLSLAGASRAQAVSRQMNLSPATPFLIRMADHRLRVSTDNGLWLADQPLPEGATNEPGALLSLGSTTGQGHTVRFRDLEWRAPAAAK